MSVNAGAEEEYEERHNPIWPELEKVLKGHGVLNYSSFLLPETHSFSATPKSRARNSGCPLA